MPGSPTRSQSNPITNPRPNYKFSGGRWELGSWQSSSQSIPRGFSSSGPKLLKKMSSFAMEFAMVFTAFLLRNLILNIGHPSLICFLSSFFSCTVQGRYLVRRDLVRRDLVGFILYFARRFGVREIVILSLSFFSIVLGRVHGLEIFNPKRSHRDVF